MIKKIKSFLKLLKKFGIFSGLIIYLKLSTGNVNNIKLPCIKHSFSLRRFSSDIPTFFQVFLSYEYDIKFAKYPKIIIDGGANVGLFAIKMKNEFPETKIICIEPDPDNFQILRKNLSRYKDVFCEESGLWHKNTRLKVYDKYNIGKWGMVVEEDLITGNVDAISLNFLLEKYSIQYIDILKLDIETSEKQLFSEDYERWLPKVKTIVIELHDWIEHGCAKAFFVAINTCFTDYTFAHIGENVIITNNDIA